MCMFVVNGGIFKLLYNRYVKNKKMEAHACIGYMCVCVCEAWELFFLGEDIGTCDF